MLIDCTVIALAIGLKTIPDVLDINYTQASHMPTSPTPHICDDMGCVCHVGHAVRSSRNQLLLWLEHAKFLFHQWNN